MDKLAKEMRKISNNDLTRVYAVLEKIKHGNIDSLQIKLLQGHQNTYRVRVGRIRVMYTADKNGSMHLLAVRQRNEKTL
jgi:mRNA-degrading endonuclease RelE of RelBE toxin-antitoxin system